MKSLVQLVSEKVIGTGMAGVNMGCKDKRKGGSVEDDLVSFGGM